MSDRIPGPGRLGAGALNFIERNLTLISVGVLLVGVVLVGTGPARSMFDRPGGLSQQPSEEEAAASRQGPVTLLRGTGGAGPEAEPVFDRIPEPFTIVPNRQRDEVISYTVRPGDTIFDLAERFGVNMETIFWANSETLQDNVHLLIPGVDIFILPVDGVYYRATGEETIAQIAEKFLADPDDILEAPYNELPIDSTTSFVPPLGMRLVIPGGKREQIDFAWVVPAEKPTAAGSGPQTFRFAPNHPGSCAPVAGGGGTGAWVRPINRYYRSDGFHYGHTGVDLASTAGEPIYAADTGVVIFAGWNDWGYGNLVVLDHGNGWTTFYAHMSSVLVGCGQRVPRGSQVGAVGTTGRSSGPHLHFEMRWYMNPDNPEAYIGF